MKSLEGCTFCNVKPGDKAQIAERTIIETPNFRVFPTLGQISDGGYLLMVPKEHFYSVGDMPDAVIKELMELKSEVGKKIRYNYKDPIFFEHGGIGQTIMHAHMHALPCDSSQSEQIMKDIKRDFKNYWNPIQSLMDLKNIWKYQGMYVYFEGKDGQAIAAVTPAVPMYARTVIANNMGVSERANWRTMERPLDERLIAETIQKLR